jgi:hypothetical protein
VQDISPCSCGIIDNKTHLYCVSDDEYPNDYIKNVFRSLNRFKSDVGDHFETFILEGSGVKYIPDNLFMSATFSNIIIRKTMELRKIHSNAFKSTAERVQRFEFFNNGSLFKITTPSHNMLEIFSQFINADTIKIQTHEIKNIPSRIPSNTKSYLKYLFINKGSLESIGDHAFYELVNLKQLHLNQQPIRYISSMAFKFGLEEESALRIPELDISMKKCLLPSLMHILTIR